MPDRRTAMALLMAASVFALPTSLLAGQEEKKPASTNRNTIPSEAQAGLLKAAQQRTPQFFFAGPSRFAIGSASRPTSNVSAARQYTEEELREIRAAQLRLVREVGAGPSPNPSGGVVLSHPTLGRIIVSRPGPIGTGVGNPVGKPTLPNPGSSAGPSHIGDPGSSEPKGGSGSPGEPGDFPVLQPGSGFRGATAQPPAVGHSGLRGYDAKAIARWDVVPYQDFDGLFHIGVVAFHMNGIDRVEFSVEGGPWTPVTEMKLNPRTNVWEYTATLDASKFDDGLVEVRARVFPRNAGEVRVLGGEITPEAIPGGVHSLKLFAQNDRSNDQSVYVGGSGSDETGDGTRRNPFQTTMKAVRELADRQGGQAGGGTVYLLPGEHQLGPYSFSSRARSGERFVRITPAEGVRPEDAPLIGSFNSDGLRIQRLLIDGALVRLDGDARRGLSNTGHDDCTLWVRDSRMVGAGRTSRLSFTSGWTSAYYTDVAISDAMNGVSAPLVRNVTIENIGSDAVSNSRFVINTTVRNIDRSGTDFHPDVYQVYGPSETFENLIIYGLHAYDAHAQGIFVRGVQGIKDVAFVNVLIDLANPIMLSQWRSPVTEHVLFWHVTHLNKPFWFRLDGDRSVTEASYHNMSFVGSVFETILDDANMVAEATFDHVHDIRGRLSLPGVDITTGDPLFVNPAADDYALLPTSPLRNRVTPGDRHYKVWDEQGRPVDTAHVGAWDLRRSVSR